jgi:hypothetical protein
LSPAVGSSFPLTPAAFLEAVAARIDRLHGADAAPVLLREIPVRTSGTAREYGGFVYAGLRDPRTSDTVDARIPVAVAGNLEWNREAVFVGLLHYRVRRGELRPEFRVDAVQGAGPLRLPSKDDLLQRWAAVIARPKRDVRAALEGPAPRLAVVTGVGSVAVDDVRAQLREAEDDLAVEVVRVSMHRPAEVARAIRNTADVHAVALTRGGGQDVHELDAEELIAAVASSPVPVLVALGHASDELVLGRVADASFLTPTALGAWLREVVENKRRQARQAEEARLVAESKELLTQLGQLPALRAALTRWRLLVGVMAAVWAATVTWLVLLH